jgi:hypothetical protein
MTLEKAHKVSPEALWVETLQNTGAFITDAALWDARAIGLFPSSYSDGEVRGRLNELLMKGAEAGRVTMNLDGMWTVDTFYGIEIEFLLAGDDEGLNRRAEHIRALFPLGPDRELVLTAHFVRRLVERADWLKRGPNLLSIQKLASAVATGVPKIPRLH